ncbi:MAG: tRNA pseudouridine(38-40) synthase TruA [Clostridia bacterium]|nr:tRNA pseudouridine(38-40) synthase TruA [Clostridia bacterium]
MRKIKLVVQYVGTNYCGWQKQKNGKSVQEVIEKAILKVLGEPCQVFGAGRTDAGVHAEGQVAHFETIANIYPPKLYHLINTALPDDIRILNSEEVSSDFHSRFSAKKKTYEYKFYVSDTILPLLEQTQTRVGYEFCYKKAKKACKFFVGTHNFSAFCASGTKVKDTTRTIYSLKLNKVSEKEYSLMVCGNGFLYNMVRILAGTIIEVGLNKKEASDIKNIIKSGKRELAGKTMPAKGLTLKKIEYE